MRKLPDALKDMSIDELKRVQEAIAQHIEADQQAERKWVMTISDGSINWMWGDLFIPEHREKLKQRYLELFEGEWEDNWSLLGNDFSPKSIVKEFFHFDAFSVTPLEYDDWMRDALR